MAEKKVYIAVDLGAESGRVMLSEVTEDKITLEEIHRFTDENSDQNGALKWDIETIFGSIKEGIAKAVKKADRPISGIGVDSWGVDYGLIDKNGELIERPYHYRDSRTDLMMEKAFGLLDKRQIYENTGLQFMQFNTAYQLLAHKLQDPETLSKADKLIFIADLISYFLCGRQFAEYSLASTSQFMDMKTGTWSKQVLDKLGLPQQILPEIVMPGTVVGKLKDELCKELDCDPIDIIAIGSHDTASAVAAVPAAGENWAYLSSGTWSLMGLEVPKAIINDQTFAYPFTNEGGVENTIRLLKNIMGLWLVQECRRHWEGLNYDQITEMAANAKPFAAHIDCDRQEFFAPGNMPKKINDYLKQTNQSTITDKGQMVRVILESLALKYRNVIETLESICGNTVETLHIVGGGIQNNMLCQFAANATGKKVLAGPIEATAAGNIIIQAKAAGQIKSLSQARKIVANSFELNQYLPSDQQVWTEQYKKITKD